MKVKVLISLLQGVDPEALALLDVRVLDQVIVSASQSLSMAERGLL